MFPTSSNPGVNKRRIATALVALLFVVCADSASAQQPTTSQPESAPEVAAAQNLKSRYPAVVLESNASFSIPNVSAQPAAATKNAVAQPFLPKEIYQRTAKPVLEATELISDGFGRSVVGIFAKENRIALGTVVGLNGHVITKYSLVRDVPKNQIRFRSNDLSWAGTIVGFDEKNDMALFVLHSGDKRPGNVLRPVSFTTDGYLNVGKIVIGIGSASKSLAVGMTTAPPTPGALEADAENFVDMGMALNAGMTLTRVYPRTVGERLGMLVGDQILMVNQQRISTLAEFQQFEKNVQVGDLITITYQRDGQAFVISDKVPSITKNSKQDRWGGGPFSLRRSGFEAVLVHDSVINPTDCGGPLVNLKGQFCGVNIARSMRVCSLAIPAEHVKEFVLKYLGKAEMIIGR